MPQTRRLTITLDSETAGALDRLMKRERRSSKSDTARVFLRDAIARREKGYRKLLHPTTAAAVRA